MNATKILCSLKLNERFLSLWKIPRIRRTFLTEAYQCKTAWDDRLKTPLLKKINAIDFYFELNNKIENKEPFSALDVDIFTNCIEKPDFGDEISTVLHKLRLTRETTNTLDSTHHAVVRYFLSIGETELLLSMLNDRLNYGLFCDYVSYNLLMDYFIKKEDYASGAKVASFMMLQEEFENPISNALAIYCCHNYLKNPDTWKEEDPKAEPKEKPKEVIKIRVKYLRNYYFDDHFDLWKPSDLVGKTLWWVGLAMDTTIGRSCQLRGLILYNKHKEAIEYVKKWKEEGIQKVIYKDTISLIKNDTPEVFNDGENASDVVKELKSLIADLENSDLHEGNLDDDITNLVKEAVDKHSQEDISNQIQIYNEWNETRMKILQEHKNELQRQKRISDIENLKKTLVEKERLLTFFEKEEEIELQIEEKLEREKQLYGDEKIIDNEEEIVRPELKKRGKQ